MPKKTIFISREHRERSKDQINKAISIIGTQEAMANILQCSQTIVSYWSTGRHVISIPNAKKCESITNKAVTLKDLRPDIFE